MKVGDELFRKEALARHFRDGASSGVRLEVPPLWTWPCLVAGALLALGVIVAFVYCPVTARALMGMVAEPLTRWLE